ncbi:MAG: cytochrome P450 [Planctomycetaceae bacterium]|nr:cytochrome P450 [Planctomycetaceae bacterium]
MLILLDTHTQQIVSMIKNTPSISPCPPGPPTRLVATQDGRSPIDVLQELADTYGDVVRYQTRFGTFTLVNDPQLASDVLNSHDYVRSNHSPLKTILGNGLLVTDGPAWQRTRQSVLPEFTPARISRLAGLFRDVTIEETNRLSADPRELNFSDLMNRIALSNITRPMFNCDLGDEFLKPFSLVLQQLGEITNSAVFGLPLIRGPQANKEFKIAMMTIEGIVSDLTQKHEARQMPFLSSICEAFKNNDAKTVEKQLRDEVLSFVIAGHETTAVSMSWFWYAILSHPEVMQKFYDEVDHILQGKPITIEDVPRLAYTQQILNETLRLYPAIWMISRTAIGKSKIGGYPIPADSNVVVSPYIIHRRPESWNNPHQFDPDRFRHESAERNRAFIPFLTGRHICIGKHFALLEAVIVAATLAQQFRFRPAASLSEDFLPLLSLRMRQPFMIQLESR